MQIIINQLPAIFGMPSAPDGNTFSTFYYWISNLWKHANLFVVLISFVTMAFMFGIDRLKKRYPDSRALKYFPAMGAAILMGTLVSYCFDFPGKGIATIGNYQSLYVE